MRDVSPSFNEFPWAMSELVMGVPGRLGLRWTEGELLYSRMQTSNRCTRRHLSTWPAYHEWLHGSVVRAYDPASQGSWVRIPLKLEFFFRQIFATAKFQLNDDQFSLEKLEKHSASPRATQTLLSCSPNFPACIHSSMDARQGWTIFLTLFRLGGGGWRHPRLKSFINHERLPLQCSYFVTFPRIYLGTIWLINLLPWQPNSGALLRSYLVHSCFHFNFLCSFHLSIGKTDYISYLMKLFNKSEAKKISFDSILTKFEIPKWPP